ncbi:transposase [Paenibacillus sp. RC73]
MTRNKHSREFKRQIVKEAIETGNKAAVARRYEIAVNMLQRWVKEFEEGKYGETSLETIHGLDSKVLSQENDQLKKPSMKDMPSRLCYDWPTSRDLATTTIKMEK